MSLNDFLAQAMQDDAATRIIELQAELDSRTASAGREVELVDEIDTLRRRMEAMSGAIEMEDHADQDALYRRRRRLRA